jgi:hypothetical protein
MSDPARAPLPLPLPVDHETMARLHGEACIECGATDQLAPAGHAHTVAGDGGVLGWPVKACPEHQEPEAGR